MTRHILLLTALMSAATVCRAQDDDAPDMSPDEAAIRANIQAYLDAFQNEDVDAAVALWTEEGEYFVPGGEMIKGHDALREAFQQFFEENEGTKIDLGVPAIRIPSPSIGVEEGVAHILRPDSDPEVLYYTAVHVKTGGEWKLDTLHESDPPPPSPNDHLQELSWLLGEWVDADAESALEISCEFTKNGNFIRRSFRSFAGDEISIEGTQIIGWDGARQVFRSWMFDTEGGFGEGLWERDGDRWEVRMTQTLGDGSRASSLNTFHPQEDGSYIWRSTGREVGGQLQPNIGPITVVSQ